MPLLTLLYRKSLKGSQRARVSHDIGIDARLLIKGEVMELLGILDYKIYE
jgi:hypothetical protein